MGEVSAVLTERWRSQKHVGAAAPSMIVRVTRGLIDKVGWKNAAEFSPRAFAFLEEVTWEELYAQNKNLGIIVGEGEEEAAEPWQGLWRSTDETGPEGKIVPNVLSVKWQTGFAQKGLRSATVEIENIFYEKLVGPGGVYHAIRRGYLAPWLGVKIAGRLIAEWEAAANEWQEIFAEGVKVDVYEGYGDHLSHTFTGVIDQCDLETFPDRITLTCRSFVGSTLVDERVVGDNKSPVMLSPITIADRERTQGVMAAGSGPVASSEELASEVPRPVANIVKPGNLKDWVSKGHAGAGAVEWIELTLPPGHYTDLYLHTPYAGMEAYVSIFAKNASKWNGAGVAEGWINGGKGEAPGGGGVFYTDKVAATVTKGGRISLGGVLDADEGTILRVTFTKLPLRAEWGDHRAAAYRLAGMKFGKTVGELAGDHFGWLLIEEVAEAVKRVLAWMGFHEYITEDLGYSLVQAIKYTAGEFFIDIIDYLASQADWVFYEQAPTGHIPNEGDPWAIEKRCKSLGVPCFVHNTARDPVAEGILEVTEADLLESVHAKIDLSSLPFIIRYRGAVTPDGTATEGDLTHRYNAVYFPPWSGAGPDEDEPGRTAGIRRHEITRDRNLLSDEACEFAARLAAYQYALEAFQAEIQVAGYPGIELNQQISVIDKTTAVNSRLWVSSIQSEHTTGPQGEWRMTVGGALIDGFDIQEIVKDLEELRAAADAPRVIGSFAQP